MNATTGITECDWTAAATLTTQASWTSGIYLAVLTNAQAFVHYEAKPATTGAAPSSGMGSPRPVGSSAPAPAPAPTSR
jgi:hypothetical protein